MCVKEFKAYGILLLYMREGDVNKVQGVIGHNLITPSNV